MTNLKEINFGFNEFCGPSVMSAITGESTDRCAAVISAVSGKSVIKAVSIAHLKEAFRRLRFDVTDVDFSSTLYGTLMRLSDKDGFYIIMVPKHVVAIEVVQNQVWLVDNASKQPLPANSSARLMQRVEHAFRVERKKAPVLIAIAIRAYRSVTNIINIKHISEYENTEDNTEYSLGQIRFRDEDELKQILTALDWCVVHRHNEETDD